MVASLSGTIVHVARAEVAARKQLHGDWRLKFSPLFRVWSILDEFCMCACVRKRERERERKREAAID